MAKGKEAGICRGKKEKIALLLILMLAFFAACGKKEGGDGRDGEGTGQAPKQAVPYSEQAGRFREKADKLRDLAVTEEINWELGVSPAGEAGNAVFFSVCDTLKRAHVYSGTGVSLEEAWETAAGKAEEAIGENGCAPVWVKADIVYISEEITGEELHSELKSSRPGFFRYGMAFDSSYQTALLEAELNGVQVYEYEEGSVDLEALNRYLEESGRNMLNALPEDYLIFQCLGWICDDDGQIYFLDSNQLDYGRRKVDVVDKACVEDMLSHASAYLASHVNEDGTFDYGVYPQFDEKIEGYNMVRHAGSAWALLCRYRMSPNEELAGAIRKSIGYMTEQIVYDDEGRAFLYDASEEEIKLGGCGLAVVALSEYVDVFQDGQYMDVCHALGDGILSLLDQETGEYVHVLNHDFSQKEEFRTEYYDGEATFALCRLYGLTGDGKWLEAAKSAVGHFIEADYTQYCDQWVAYTMNEITKYETDNPEFYIFALLNAQKNMASIYQRDTTYHTHLELLMATFELYDRMVENSAVEGFDEESFLKTIYARAERMRSGYFYPEYAMYMKNPQQIQNTFMVRQEGYRVRIDDVQHNILGYCLYAQNYDKLVKYGLLEYQK